MSFIATGLLPKIGERVERLDDYKVVESGVPYCYDYGDSYIRVPKTATEEEINRAKIQHKAYKQKTPYANIDNVYTYDKIDKIPQLSKDENRREGPVQNFIFPEPLFNGSGITFNEPDSVPNSCSLS
jgi:hypothetical protein